MSQVTKLEFNNSGAASEHLQLQGNLLDKALSIHEVELTQALNAKKKEIENDSESIKASVEGKLPVLLSL